MALLADVHVTTELRVNLDSTAPKTCCRSPARRRKNAYSIRFD
jgi:hypothetical protein